MCIMPSAPSMPALPANPVQTREAEAKAAKKETKSRLAKRKGGRQFLNSEQGYIGLADTLLGVQANKL